MTPTVPNFLPLLPELSAAPSPLVGQAAVLPAGGGAATLDFAGLLDAAALGTPAIRMPEGGAPDPAPDAAPPVAPILPPAPQLGGAAPELPAELSIASVPERAAAMLLPTGKDLPGTGARLPLASGSAPKPQRALADVVSEGMADPAIVSDSPAVPALADIDAPEMAQADEGLGTDDAADPDAAPVIVAAAPLAPIPAAIPVASLAAIPAGSGVASERSGAATSPLSGPALPAVSPPPIMATQAIALEPGQPILPGAPIGQAVAAPAAKAMAPSPLSSEPRDAAAPPSGPPRPAASAALRPADSGDDAALTAAPSMPSAPTAAPALASAPAGDTAMAAPAALPQGSAPAQFPTQTQTQPQAAAASAAADRGGDQRTAAGTIESTIAQVGSLREAVREARPAMTVQHAEFGAVSVRLEQAAPDQWRAVLASRDPGFVPAIHAALDTRAVAAADASASFAQHHGASQNGAGDQRYGASPNGGQGSSQPYPGHSGSHGGDAAPDHRRPSTTATLAGRSSEGDEGSDASAAHRAQGGLFA
ncbi:hypothetical protein A9D12_06090 [Erythrobacter neustonensis]|uniref:Uncharacterized protein n=2 Tax=Erythrobacter neustonensis TaxID=1112 RepID=A0A192D275_9SPHN|nr:hypothetical protein A9D12_06090 [Erythrobacter neustonensis]